MALPVRLGNPPLIEMMFEVRFSEPHIELSELLPARVLSKLSGRYSKLGTLPAAGLPRRIRDENPDLWYQPLHSLSGESGVITIGERAITLATAAYPGWSNFRREIEELLAQVHDLLGVFAVERYSLRAANVISSAQGYQLLPLDLEISVRGVSVGELGLRLQVELPRDPLTTLVVVQTGAVTASLNEKREGVLLVVDSICKVPEAEFLVSPENGLDALHAEQRRVFFQFVSDETLVAFKPEY